MHVTIFTLNSSVCQLAQVNGFNSYGAAEKMGAGARLVRRAAGCHTRHGKVVELSLLAAALIACAPVTN
jgi:hypothetical protein